MSKKSLVFITIVAVLLALAVLLNPSPERHRSKIKEVIAERTPIAGALGLGALTAFTSTYHSWSVASFTTVNDRTVSVGAFGIVYVMQSSPDK
ncbi:hypothetical protein [Piscinibacter terrae]|uniref:Uncharacterized protein n=1 Tax=Piscinibacter terrae TaxID=2496871 RepID=A0A3N7IRJ7_9BURK|nr:hypothetical protein [Albitalea terrae]RQP21502.1 hypothetical protein DZC73_26655 [Albitalea terrae]